MKKILILSPFPIDDINGTSVYIYQLVGFLLSKKTFEIFYFSYFLSNNQLKQHHITNSLFHIISLNYQKTHFLVDQNEQDIHMLNSFCVNYQKIIEINALIYENIDFDTYDLIIDCTSYQHQELMQRNNYIFSQQMSPQWYIDRTNVLLKVDLKDKEQFHNPLLVAKKLVLFDQYQLKPNEYQQHFCIPLASYRESFIQQHAKTILNNVINKKYLGQKIIYYGRINNYQKNIGFINAMNEQNQTQIYMYGPIEGNTQVTNYLGKLQRHEIQKTVDESAFIFLASKSEGFSYSIVEALSLGTPVFIRNTYPSAQFLAGNNHGFLIEQNLTPVQALAFLQKTLKKLDFMQYKKIVQNCLAFALKELTLEKFEERWWKIISQY